LPTPPVPSTSLIPPWQLGTTELFVFLSFLPFRSCINTKTQPSPLILAPHLSSYFSVSLSYHQKGATRFHLVSIQIPSSPVLLRASTLSKRPVGDDTIPNFTPTRHPHSFSLLHF
jgi:hypothetical protein